MLIKDHVMDSARKLCFSKRKKYSKTCLRNFDVAKTGLFQTAKYMTSVYM